MKRLLLTAAAIVVLVTFVPNASAQDKKPQNVTWQSAGDSYSAGEGVFGNVGACAQSSDAYGPTAASVLRSRGWGIAGETFTACTGHLIEDVFNARGGTDKSSLWQWGREQGGPERVDVLTLSMGGNDVGFPDIIFDCLIGMPDSWREAVLGGVAGSLTGCDKSEADLSARVDALLDPPRSNCTTNRRTAKAYDCDMALEGRRGSIIDFYYDLVNSHLTARGRLYVVGYPRIFSDPDQWSRWTPAACTGVKRGDTEKLGRLAQHFNDKLQEAVNRANEALGSNRVVFIDRFAQYRDGQHELCGRGEDWMNGIAIDRGEGPGLRKESSFHPNAAGHAATAARLANTADATFPKSLGPTWDEIKNASIPEMCEHSATRLVNGEDPNIGEFGYFKLLPKLANGKPGLVSGIPSEAGPLTAVVAACSQGGPNWPNTIMFFSEGGRYYGDTDMYDGPWESLGMSGPGRDGVTAMTVEGDQLEVATMVLTNDDYACCASANAVVRLRPQNGTIQVVDLRLTD